ncbi:TonB-dependent receptor [Rhodocytophaga aerolata]|uniref:TonB-dependent receptor n=1 Tax=Rhodocytophaga aerolata TaxID=455078 RepID=A0ABT8R0L2_9BACT|nr:TonB-dependent receptor [Rhodocytophaga aerolata]MDO1444793.1 TonB-dependent receptor [Rhodocytophaga aerolata]
MIRKLTHGSMLFLASCLISPVYSQTLASSAMYVADKDSDEQKGTQSLKSALQSLEATYKVTFFYKTGLIEGLSIDASRRKTTQSLDEDLRSLLAKHNLVHKKAGEAFYVIIPREEQEAKEIKKVETGLLQKNQNFLQVSQAPLLASTSLSLIYSQKAFAVSGRITDENGEGLPGVNVLVKGTTNGTTSAADGSYSLSAPDGNSTLVFSYIGYVTQEVPINNRATLNVSLVSDVQSLNEVVVVGYGTVKKSDLTGSVATIKADKLLERNVTSVGQALQGRIAGVDVAMNTAAPGKFPKVRIRGINSINSSVDPLYVVDGVVGVNANALNPNDIESLEVLKDASATAIYGARGANGVIMITTKRGTRNRSSVSYEGWGSYAVPASSVDRLNAQEFMQVYNTAFANAAKYDPQGFADGKYVPNNPADFPNLFDANGNPLYDTNWEKEVYKPAWAQNHQLNLQGGAEKSAYGLSLGMTDQNGIMLNSGLKRYSGRFTLDSDVKKWLTMGGSISITRTRQLEVDDANGGLNVPRMVFEAVPILPIKYPNGTWGRNRDWPGMEGGENPVRLATERQRTNHRTETLGDVYALFKIAPGLEFRSTFGYNLINEKRNFYSGRDLAQMSADQKGIADIWSRQRTYWQSENYLTWNKDINESHRFTAMAGLSWQEQNTEEYSAQTQNFIDDFFGYHNLGVGTVRSGIGSYDDRWALNSYFARINYTLNDKYLLTLTGRVDGSSRFGANNKYAFFPSAGVAWRISEESFLKGNPTLSNLKLRASAGATGNQEISLFQSLQFLGTQEILLDGNRQTAISRTSFGNPDLKWEVTNQYDIGLEIGLFQNRVELTADAYYKRTNDLLLAAPIPWSTGLSNVTQNIGSVENRGLEFSLNTFNIQSPNFSWNTNINWSTFQNKILKLGVNNDDIFPGPWFLGQTNILRVGLPIGTFWGYKRLGTWGTAEADEAAKYDRLPGDLKWADLNNDGVIDGKDETTIGRMYPKWTMNIANTLNWKGFDFTFDIRFVMGADIVNATKHSVEDRQAIANSMATVLNAWTPENQNTHIAQIRHYNAGYDTHMDDWWLEDGSFIRGQNFVLGYSLPATLIERLKMQRLRFYASAQNLFLISDYSGYDPEAETFGGQLIQNIEFFQYPKPRTFNLGVNVTF